MGQFLFGFVFYTLGSMGILLIGYIIAKKVLNSMGPGANKNSKAFLNVEQGLPLEPRKTIYVVKAGNQRFLIAATPENVSCIGELNKENVPLEARAERQQLSSNPYRVPQQVPQNRNPQQASPTVQKMHPDLAKTLKYQNFVKGILGNNSKR